MADDDGARRPGAVVDSAAAQFQLAARVAARCLPLALAHHHATPHIAFEHHGIAGKDLYLAGLAPLRIAGFQPVATHQGIAPGFRLPPARALAREIAGDTDVVDIGHGLIHRIQTAIGALEPGGGVDAVGIADRATRDVDHRTAARNDGATCTQHDFSGIRRQFIQIGLADAHPACHVAQRRADPFAGHVYQLPIRILFLDPLHAGHRRIFKHAVFAAVDDHFFTA